MKYVLITTARNEEAHLENTIRSVTNQTIRPEKWIIVSDGSTDRTDEIGNKYSESYDFIQLLSLKRCGKRNFGSMASAFNEGYKMIKDIEYNFIGNLDADISFDPNYYESVLEKFHQNQLLGLAGGFIYEKEKEEFKIRKFNSVRSVPHAVQLFRKECYEAIGEFLPLKYGGTDWCAEVMSRMKGWHVETFPELKVYHHRRTSALSLLGSFRQGLKDYSIGSHPIFEILKCIYRITGKPYLIGALLRMSGFIWAYCEREDRIVDNDFIMFLRAEQMGRVKSLFWK